MSLTLTRAAQFLDGLLADLYRRVPGVTLPEVGSIAIIDDPRLAREVLGQPDIFVKNYTFLQEMAHGRFTANGVLWRQRAALTRDWYRDAHRQLTPVQLRDIYTKHLAGGTVLDAAALSVSMTAAAVEIFSLAIGLPHTLTWPAPLLVHMRDCLRMRQWIDWNGCDATTLEQVQLEMRQMRDKVRTLWQGDPASSRLLAQLQHAGLRINDFDAAEELMQNLLAASETTASSLLWAAEALSQQPEAQAELAADPTSIGRFIAEVLRMFPPVPYLTRRCIVPHMLEGRLWQPGEVLSISIVGIHRNPYYWNLPDQFDSRRAEFNGGATPLAYMPFSKGQRVCAGIRLANMELQAAIEAMLRSYRFEPGANATLFGYGLSSYPKTSLYAVPQVICSKS